MLQQLNVSSSGDDRVTNDIMVSGVSLYPLIGLLVTVSVLCYIAQNWIGSVLQYNYLSKILFTCNLDRSITYLKFDDWISNSDLKTMASNFHVT